MSDSISKAEVLETYAELYDIFDDNKEIRKKLSKVYDKLNKLPYSEPEIITCENCKYGNVKPIADGRRWCKLHNDYMYYCSDAEVRTGE